MWHGRIVEWCIGATSSQINDYTGRLALGYKISDDMYNRSDWEIREGPNTLAPTTDANQGAEAGAPSMCVKVSR